MKASFQGSSLKKMFKCLLIYLRSIKGTGTGSFCPFVTRKKSNYLFFQVLEVFK